MSARRDAAKAAALAERDRLHVPASDYAVGRMVEAAIAVLDGREPDRSEPEVWDINPG